jgi:hypothetical protein
LGFPELALSAETGEHAMDCVPHQDVGRSVDGIQNSSIQRVLRDTPEDGQEGAVEDVMLDEEEEIDLNEDLIADSHRPEIYPATTYDTDEAPTDPATPKPSANFLLSPTNTTVVPPDDDEIVLVNDHKTAIRRDQWSDAAMPPQTSGPNITAAVPNRQVSPNALAVLVRHTPPSTSHLKYTSTEVGVDLDATNAIDGLLDEIPPFPASRTHSDLYLSETALRGGGISTSSSIASFATAFQHTPGQSPGLMKDALALPEEECRETPINVIKTPVKFTSPSDPLMAARAQIASPVATVGPATPSTPQIPQDWMMSFNTPEQQRRGAALAATAGTANGIKPEQAKQHTLLVDTLVNITSPASAEKYTERDVEKVKKEMQTQVCCAVAVYHTRSHSLWRLLK